MPATDITGRNKVGRHVGPTVAGMTRSYTTVPNP